MHYKLFSIFYILLSRAVFKCLIFHDTFAKSDDNKIMVNKTKDNVLIIIMSLFSISIEITMIKNNIATAKRKILWLKLLLITFFEIKAIGQK